jgi:hypothetical protein
MSLLHFILVVIDLNVFPPIRKVYREPSTNRFAFKTLHFRTNRACMRQSEVHVCGSWRAITHAHALSEAKLELGLIQSKRQEFL